MDRACIEEASKELINRRGTSVPATFTAAEWALQVRRQISATVLPGTAAGRRAEVVVAPGPDPRPLGGRAAVQPKLATSGTPTLRPALGRVLPELLPPVHG